MNPLSFITNSRNPNLNVAQIYLVKHDWVVLLDPAGISHDIITPRRGDVLQFIRVNDNDSTIGEFLHLPSNQPLNIFAERTLKLNK